MKIPLCRPFVGKEEKELISKVLDSGWYAHGPKCAEFEQGFAKYIGAKHAVSLNSCTSALHLALQANNITGEVIVPSFTFVASANAVITAGARPVLCDVDFDTCNIDMDDAERIIAKDTQAIMPVHFAGLPCDMKRVMEIAEKHNLKVIEDSAECIGGEFQGQKTGSFGLGCFSFYPTKNMTTGEGGMLTLNSDEALSKMKALKGHGILSSTYEREKQKMPWLRSASYAGYNFRMSDILAAMGIVQLKKLDKMNELRRQHAGFLNKNISSELIEKPVEPKGYRHVYQMYQIKLDTTVDRTAFVKALNSQGIGASVHFDPPVHQQEYYKNFNMSGLDNTTRLAKSIVTLPMFPQLKREQLDYMANNIEIAVKKSIR